MFTSGATHSLNLLAKTLGPKLEDGDEIVLSVMEHHSNIVPWQMLRDFGGVDVKIKWCNLDEEGGGKVMGRAMESCNKALLFL